MAQVSVGPPESTATSDGGFFRLASQSANAWTSVRRRQSRSSGPTGRRWSALENAQDLSCVGCGPARHQGTPVPSPVRGIAARKWLFPEALWCGLRFGRLAVLVFRHARDTGCAYPRPGHSLRRDCQGTGAVGARGRACRTGSNRHRCRPQRICLTGGRTGIKLIQPHREHLDRIERLREDLSELPDRRHLRRVLRHVAPQRLRTPIPWPRANSSWVVPNRSRSASHARARAALSSSVLARQDPITLKIRSGTVACWSADRHLDPFDRLAGVGQAVAKTTPARNTQVSWTSATLGTSGRGPRCRSLLQPSWWSLPSHPLRAREVRQAKRATPGRVVRRALRGRPDPLVLSDRLDPPGSEVPRAKCFSYTRTTAGSFTSMAASPL